jgi:hypothetical protein
VQVSGYVSVKVCGCQCMQLLRCASVKVCKFKGVQVSMYAGVKVCRCQIR